jgi:hypothetical protein
MIKNRYDASGDVRQGDDDRRFVLPILEDGNS